MEKEDFIKRLTELRINKGVSARDMSLSIGKVLVILTISRMELIFLL